MSAPALDGTPEGLAAAAAAREALKQKKRSLEVRLTMQLHFCAACAACACSGRFSAPLIKRVSTAEAAPAPPGLLLPQQQQGAAPAAPAAAKKAAGERPPPSCTHEVAVPPDYDVAAAQAALDPALHGGSLPGSGGGVAAGIACCGKGA